MLTEDQRDRIEVVLVSPRNPLNIGATARAMANFGFSSLAVVAPFEAHWREARSAVGAPDLLSAAKETVTLADAVKGCTLVIGTGTITYRKPEQPVVPLPLLTPIVEGELQLGGRVALVFGPEKHGLTREDLSYCRLFVGIPTDARQPSMNLGQAAAVCLYELARPIPIEKTTGARDQNSAETAPNAASGSLDLLAELIGQTMTAVGYSPRIMEGANRHDLRLLLRRLRWTEGDARHTLGVFRRILWRLAHPSDQSTSSDEAPQ